jgi:DNA-binding NtrC family response regulator
VVDFVGEKVLAVGLNNGFPVLKELPIQLIRVEKGRDAISWLRRAWFIRAMLAKWDLPDMRDGILVKRIKAAKPWFPTIVLLEEPFLQREVAVRSLGVAAVLPHDVDRSVLCQVIVDVLRLERAVFKTEGFRYEKEYAEEGT